jgi:CMP-N-acetylneuraminic acid synthetase
MEVPHQFNPVSVMREQDGRLLPFLDGPSPSRRQDKPRVLARNGPAVLAVRAEVVAAGSLYGHDCRPLLMAPSESLDIDTPADLELLECYLARRRP